jgi:hypothetical protein
VNAPPSRADDAAHAARCALDVAADGVFAFAGHRSMHGVEARVELVERGKLPRFAYKAARVVDEG